MTDQTLSVPDIAFIGFGEAAHAIASHWAKPPTCRIRAYDTQLAQAREGDLILQRCGEAGAEPQAQAQAALSGAGIVICLVTADQALSAARDCANHISPGTLWLDGNSCAPQTKQQSAAIIEAAGGRYVDMAIMAPVYPKRHLVPLLLSGPYAQEAAELLSVLGMKPALAGDKVGDASSIKMLRSVMIKGLEALTSECLLAARRAGVEDAVLASLQASDPGIDWRARGAYNLERMMVHGERRAAEMQEVCVTLTAFGIPDWISRGTVEWQRRVAGLHLEPGTDDLSLRADRVLDRL